MASDGTDVAAGLGVNDAREEAAAVTGLRVLVVDDDRLSRTTTLRQLTADGHVAAAAQDAAEALELLDARAWDVVLTDLRMPGIDGLELLRRVRTEHPEVDVLLMTAYASVETAVAAMRAGAADYLTKPFSYEELKLRLAKLGRLRHYRREVQSLRALLDADGDALGLVGDSPAMKAVIRRVHRFATAEAPVLVTGETGTGKEVVARALHRLSDRSGQPFVAVACGAIPASLAESELFGHERGAFTGATARRLGAFERADGGTLLLDDVDDLPLELQAALLRVLQDGTLTRVGGSKELRVAVRVIATTKVDLAEAAAAGRFRDDLYYRLRGLEIRLPPLRERGEDVLLIAHHLLREREVRTGRAYTLSAEVSDRLRCYRWPGNVRELRHAVEALCAACPDGTIGLAHLPDFLRRAPCGGPRPLVELNLEERDAVDFMAVVQEVERRLVEWALARADGRQTVAAELLGLKRTTLQSKLSKLMG